MATKKQKRTQALIRHLEFMDGVRKEGLKAQKADREHREKKHREGWEKKHNKSHSPKTADPACPFCQEHSSRQKHQAAKARKS